MIKRILFIIGLIFILSSTVQAQTPPWEVTVDKTDVTTDDTIRLTITIENADSYSEPVLPSLADFQVLGSSRSSQMTIINGDVTSEVVYLFTLRPITTGDLVINPIGITIDGQDYLSNAILVQVAQGTQPIIPNLDPSLAALSDADFFMEASVDNDAPYMGQQIIYKVRAFLREGLRLNAPYDLPEFSNFWRYGTEQADNRQIVETANGRYHVFEFDTYLFPMLAGEQTIDPTALGVEGALQKDNLHTEAVGVQVQPLPQPAPDDFSGAVGVFELSAVIDQNAVAVDDPITLLVSLSGTGNLETLPEPLWPEMDNWRSFAGDDGVQMAVDNGRLSGRRVYQRVLIPNSGGDFVLPPITYTYFNPDTGQYETSSSDPIPITVSGDVLPASTAVSANADENTAPVPAEPASNDIRHIKPAPTNLQKRSDPISQSPLYWVLWFIPFLALTADFLRTRRQQQFDPVLARRSQAAQQAVAQLQAEGDGHTAVHQALNHYLSLKLDQPITGLTQTQMRQLLQEQGVTGEVIEQVAGLLHWSEIGRFSPVNGNIQASEAVSQTRQVISELEKIL